MTRQCVAVQTEYLEALKLAIAQSKRLMNDLCEDIVAASVRSCGQERSQMPSLLYAKEINEWGRMLSAIANNTSHRSGWCLAAPTCTSPPLLAFVSAQMLRINVIVSLMTTPSPLQRDSNHYAGRLTHIQARWQMDHCSRERVVTLV